MILKEYKNVKKIVCYVSKITLGNREIFYCCTGKPSDASCLSWKYDTQAEAEATAQEYFDNITQFFKK